MREAISQQRPRSRVSGFGFRLSGFGLSSRRQVSARSKQVVPSRALRFPAVHSWPQSRWAIGAPVESIQVKAGQGESGAFRSSHPANAKSSQLDFGKLAGWMPAHRTRQVQSGSVNSSQALSGLFQELMNAAELTSYWYPSIIILVAQQAPPRLTAQHTRQFPQFGVNLGGFVDRVGYLRPEQPPVALAHARDGHLGRGFGHAQPAGGFGVGDVRPVAGDEDLQFLEHGLLAGQAPFLPKPADGQFQQRQRPASLEGALGRLLIARFEVIAGFGILRVQRDERPAAAALLRGCLVPFVGQKMLEGGQEEVAEAPAALNDVAEKILLDEPRKKLLREILGLLHVVAAPPRV